MSNYNKKLRYNDYSHFLVIIIIAVMLSIGAYFIALKKYYNEIQWEFANFAANQCELLSNTFNYLFTKLRLVKYLYIISQNLNQNKYEDIISSLKNETVFDAFVILEPNLDNDYNLHYFVGRLDLNKIKNISQFLKQQVIENKYVSEPFTIQGEQQNYIALHLLKNDKEVYKNVIIVGLVNLSRLLKTKVNWIDILQFMSVYVYASNNLKAPIYFLPKHEGKHTDAEGKAKELSYYNLKRSADIFYSQRIKVGDSSWILLLIPSKQYLLSSSALISWLIFTTGLIIIISLLIYSSYKIIRGVDKLKAKSTELIESESMIRNIIEYSVDGLITINKEQIIESFNPACERLFGYKAKEVIGKSVALLIPPTYLKEYTKALINCMESECRNKTTGKSFNVMKKDGSIFPIDLSISRIETQGRKIFSGIIRDITDRKESEAIKEKVINQLTENNMELEQFTHVASHDLQEQIRLILNYIGLLLSSYKQNLDIEVEKYLNKCKDSAVRMHELVLGLLEYAKLSQGIEHFDKVDCNEALSIALLNLQKVVKESNAEIIHSALPEVYGKSIAIASLFQNLISNAIKYQKKNNIPRIEIEVKSQDYYWLFRFNDNGLGIEKQYLDKVFIPFKRFHNKYEFPGTGIGLAICKRIVNRHRGEIWVESVIDQGSTFYFTIPKG